MAASCTIAEQEESDSCLPDYCMEAFGCHLQWKELEKVGWDTLYREDKILAKDKWTFETRPTYYTAVRNLQGYVAYRLKEEDSEERAIDFFQKALDKDPNNINALANLLFIARENDTHKTARKYEARLKAIFLVKNYEHRARAYADRAHAVRYFEQDKRCFHYMDYIENACVIGRSCTTPHQAEWYFDLALALYRRDVQMLYLRKLWCSNGNRDRVDSLDGKINDGFIRAARLFYDVIKITETDDLKALSWVFLGILLNHDPVKRNFHDVFPDDSHEMHAITAERCYQNCINFGKDHPIALRRAGSEYVKLGEFKKAKDLLQRSLDILESWFVFRHFGLMYLAKYDNCDDDHKKQKYLEKAEKWFIKALKFKKVHADYSDLGRVYFLMKDYDRAIRQFKLATKNEQDDFYDLVETHRRWADCLAAKGEVDGQREQLAKAREVQEQLQEPHASEDDFFRDDFEFYNAPTRSGFVRILLGSHIWCTRSQRIVEELAAKLTINPQEQIANGRKYKYHFFISYAERDRRWAFAFLHKLESEHDVRGCINHRDLLAGKSELDNRIDAIRESKKCVVILSPAYVEEVDGTASQDQQSWASFELEQAVHESYRCRRDYIIPIMLRKCEPPDKISQLTSWECLDGQIAQNHWDTLIKTLKS